MAAKRLARHSWTFEFDMGDLTDIEPAIAAAKKVIGEITTMLIKAGATHLSYGAGLPGEYEECPICQAEQN